MLSAKIRTGLPNPFGSHRAEQAQKRAALAGTTDTPNKVAPVEQPNPTTPMSPVNKQQVMKVPYNRNAKLLDDCFRTGDNPTARHWPNGVSKDAKLTAAFFKGVVRSTEMYLGYMRGMNAAEVKKRLLADVEVKSCDSFAKYILTSDPKEKAFYQSETERCMLATENFSELNDSEVKELLLQGLREKLTEAKDFADEVEHKNPEEIKAVVDSLTADGRVPFFAEVRFGMNQRLAAPEASTSLKAGNIKLNRKEKESVLEKRLAKKELGETEENPRMDLEFVPRAHFNLAKKIIRETHGDVAHNDAALIQKYKDQAASDRYPWEWDEEVEELLGNWKRGEIVRGKPKQEDQAEENEGVKEETMEKGKETEKGKEMEKGEEMKKGEDVEKGKDMEKGEEMEKGEGIEKGKKVEEKPNEIKEDKMEEVENKSAEEGTGDVEANGETSPGRMLRSTFRKFGYQSNP